MDKISNNFSKMNFRANIKITNKMILNKGINLELVKNKIFHKIMIQCRDYHNKILIKIKWMNK